MNRRNFLMGILGVAAGVTFAKFLPKPNLHPEDFRETLQKLKEALERGSYGTDPSRLSQGAALEVENLDVTMRAVTFDTGIYYKEIQNPITDAWDTIELRGFNG